MGKPATIYPEFFQRYLDEVKEDNLTMAFENQMPAAEAFFQTITEEFSNRKYAADKWTIKEVLQHIIDTERVFNYRALCFARKEPQALPSFDEKSYALYSNANNRKWKSLIEEFAAVRKSTEYLYKSFPEEVLDLVGKTNKYSISVLTLGFLTVGHLNHHIRIIQERYIGV